MSDSAEWTHKGSTFSDKTARKEFDLTQDEIIEAVRAGKLQYKENHIHGNPYLRLLRREVENLVKDKYGDNHLKDKKRENEIAGINREIRSLKIKITRLEKKKATLLNDE
ncbi:MAG: hypothetical protein DRH26_07170 [Deltaproteobacteria bacterium]|nr:MAG: hypothetical protein DRH26_07170 [Deltaproteobacteria bacterium]